MKDTSTLVWVSTAADVKVQCLMATLEDEQVNFLFEVGMISCSMIAYLWTVFLSS